MNNAFSTLSHFPFEGEKRLNIPMSIVREPLLKDMTSIEDSAELINFFFYILPLENQSMLIKKRNVERRNLLKRKKKHINEGSRKTRPKQNWKKKSAFESSKKKRKMRKKTMQEENRESFACDLIKEI